MDTNEAMQHGLGYAAGREDSAGVPTSRAANAPDGVGFMAFAEAYAAAWDEFNHGARYSMTSARSAYDTWQATHGVSIFSDPRDRTWAILARRAAA
jgi:hypothetical protein